MKITLIVKSVQLSNTIAAIKKINLFLNDNVISSNFLVIWIKKLKYNILIKSECKQKKISCNFKINYNIIKVRKKSH